MMYVENRRKTMKMNNRILLDSLISKMRKYSLLDQIAQQTQHWHMESVEPLI